MAKRSIFKLPYIDGDYSKSGEFDKIFTETGDMSVIIKVTNPVVQYSGDPDAYDGFHHLYSNILKILGEDYILQKQDIFAKKKYSATVSTDYLQQTYNEHFEGREYVDISTYLTITRSSARSFFSYDKKADRVFEQTVSKTLSVLESGKCKPHILNKAETSEFIKRILTLNFNEETIVYNNMKPSENEIDFGDKVARCISLIDIDNVELPNEVENYIELNSPSTIRGFPTDLFSFLLKVPNFEIIIYNQLITLPNQHKELVKLDQKRKRHSGVPDAANNICVDDINSLLTDVARESQLVVKAHYNIIVVSSKQNIDKATNFIASSLFQSGITPSKNSHNQLELFRCALPANGGELKVYDWYLTTVNAALCFLFKEALAVDEVSKKLVRFTDRQGVPIAIDLIDLPWETGRIKNRNRFVLGPSGSGKSFCMNTIIEQYMLFDMDVVIVDVGHSYLGLCKYFNGRYITYTDANPITMNPFAIEKDEFNIEKKDFLVTLVGVLWKTKDGQMEPVERDVISNVINCYYESFFYEYSGLSMRELEVLKFKLKAEIDDIEQFDEKYNSEKEFLYMLKKKEFEDNKVKSLSFDTFYDYAVFKIPQILEEENNSTFDRMIFNFVEFRYILRKFCTGEEYGQTLNQDVDKSLFTERFIVFEIDSIKDHAVLSPIVTLIIMDVFLQKMRFRKNTRKTLIIEEAWKAMASTIMSEFVKYLFKTVRKFDGEIIVVTQEIEDLITNPIVKTSIIDNSDTIILLDQTSFIDNFDKVANVLSINKIEQRKIFTVNQLDNKDNRARFNEVYIRRGSIGEVYGIEVSLEQYFTYTTEKPEKFAIEVYINFFDDYATALTQFVSDLKSSSLPVNEFVSLIRQSEIPYSEQFNDIALPRLPQVV